MSLQFVLGSSGSGKSHELFCHIIKEADLHPEKTYLVIVPEQFTMQTQKELVALSPNHGIMNIDILSFQRLAYRVLNEVGGETRPILEEIGKTLVTQKIVQEKEKNLGVLSTSLKKTGTISEMKSLISELMQYDIHAEELSDIINKTEEKPLLLYKLQDIEVIYQGFTEYLKDRYLTGEEILDVLCERIDGSRMMKNCEVVLDGFTGFTPVQNKLMRKILTLSQKVWVTVTLDEKSSKENLKSQQHLFHMSAVMMEKLAGLAAEERVELSDDIWIHAGEKSRFANAPALGFLEKNLFRYGNHRYEKEQNEIEVFTVQNPKAEMREIARRIQYLVRTEGYHYRDFAIITGDLSMYGSYARQIMGECEIPCFVDEKHSILMNPFVEYLRAALNMLTEQFSYESVFRYLRCGLSQLSLYETDTLENYCIAIGIRGWKRWKEHWVRRFRGMEEGSIEDINAARIKFVQETEKFAEGMKQRGLTVEERTRVLYEFICDGQVQEKLYAKEELFKKQGEQALAREYSQIYGIIMSLLDKMVQILGNEKISLEDYQQLLEAGFLEARVGIIPPTADQVLVGDMERTRLKDIKVLFFAGVNDTVIPKRTQKGGILSESDREYLDGKKVELAPTARDAMYIQKFYLYLNMTKPSSRLCMSYAKSSGQGQAQGPAYLIAMVCRMFPKIQIMDSEEQGIWHTEQASQAVNLLLEGLAKVREEEQDDEWKELLQWFINSPKWQEKCRRWMQSAFQTKPNDKIGKSVARALYGTTLENSATRLERFAACAFAHFLQYGLELSERQEYEFKPVDMGNVVHQALEQFSKNLKKYRLSWRNLTADQREKLIDESVEEMIHDYGNTILESSARNRYMITRVKRILRRTVWALQEQLKLGKYEPSKFEISFAMEDELEAIQFELSKDEKLRLRGRIDRLDRYEEEDKVYVKVIDYKSGNTSMDLIALYYGLQLQLVVYMNAALEIEQRNHPDKEVEPAGIFYYHVKDPLAEGDMMDDSEKISQKILQELKVNGLVRSEKKIILDMDETLKPGKKSSVIPAAFNKDGSLSRYSQAASREEFSTLSGYVNEKIKEIGQKILEGEAQINPYKLRKRTACDFCSFKGICGFDEKIPGYHFRNLPVFGGEYLWKKLNGED
ncbi:MAG: helicase-exonuclease AddAB subunit AddB [Clostridia bacterium]|nr:helicase-exonuclease AddAB subunit AddB [Clostridia bacterium]NCC42426.1 helicase-exonuclease AddAB subunit AddB [Clostridia bacterium]